MTLSGVGDGDGGAIGGAVSSLPVPAYAPALSYVARPLLSRSPKPRALPAPARVEAWNPPKGLTVNLPYRLRESAWSRTFNDSSQGNKVPTNEKVVNRNHQRMLRATARGLFNDRPPTLQDLRTQDKPMWRVFGFSGQIGMLHPSQRKKFLMEVNL